MSARVGLPPEQEEGSILPLLAGFVALALALILVVAAASSLYLDRKRLYTTADSAALAAAQSFPLDQVQVDAEGAVTPVLTDHLVRAAALDYLAALPAGMEDVVLEHAESPDSTSASVTLSTVWRPPLASAFLPDGIRISVTSVARTALR